MDANIRDIELIRDSIRVINDWPDKGVVFRDITTLLQDSQAFRKVIDIFIKRYKDKQIDVIAGLDARGFIFAPVVAYLLGVGFVPIRKKGKLPYTSFQESYALEYGDAATVEIHVDAIKKGDRVLIIDDLIATGGTMIAACNLIKRIGGDIVECCVINDLLYLGGSTRIREQGINVYSVLEYD